MEVADKLRLKPSMRSQSDTQKQRRRQRALRIQAQKQIQNLSLTHLPNRNNKLIQIGRNTVIERSDDEDEGKPKRPPRPRPSSKNKKKKAKIKQEEVPLSCEEDIIEGFAIVAFKSYEDLKTSVAIKESQKKKERKSEKLLSATTGDFSDIGINDTPFGSRPLIKKKIKKPEKESEKSDSGLLNGTRMERMLKHLSSDSEFRANSDARLHLYQSTTEDSRDEHVSDVSSSESGRGYMCDSESAEGPGGSDDDDLFPSWKGHTPHILPPQVPMASLPNKPVEQLHRNDAPPPPQQPPEIRSNIYIQQAQQQTTTTNNQIEVPIPISNQNQTIPVSATVNVNASVTVSVNARPPECAKCAQCSQVQLDANATATVNNCTQSTDNNSHDSSYHHRIKDGVTHHSTHHNQTIRSDIYRQPVNVSVNVQEQSTVCDNTPKTSEHHKPEVPQKKPLFTPYAMNNDEKSHTNSNSFSVNNLVKTNALSISNLVGNSDNSRPPSNDHHQKQKSATLFQPYHINSSAHQVHLKHPEPKHTGSPSQSDKHDSQRGGQTVAASCSKKDKQSELNLSLSLSVNQNNEPQPPPNTSMGYQNRHIQSPAKEKHFSGPNFARQSPLQNPVHSKPSPVLLKNRDIKSPSVVPQFPKAQPFLSPIGQSPWMNCTPPMQSPNPYLIPSHLSSPHFPSHPLSHNQLLPHSSSPYLQSSNPFHQSSMFPPGDRLLDPKPPGMSGHSSLFSHQMVNPPKHPLGLDIPPLNSLYGRPSNYYNSYLNPFGSPTQPIAAQKKTGKWNAMHVRIAWEIFNQQQKAAKARAAEGNSVIGPPSTNLKPAKDPPVPSPHGMKMPQNSLQKDIKPFHPPERFDHSAGPSFTKPSSTHHPNTHPHQPGSLIQHHQPSVSHTHSGHGHTSHAHSGHKRKSDDPPSSHSHHDKHRRIEPPTDDRVVRIKTEEPSPVKQEPVDPGKSHHMKPFSEKDRFPSSQPPPSSKPVQKLPPPPATIKDLLPPPPSMKDPLPPPTSNPYASFDYLRMRQGMPPGPPLPPSSLPSHSYQHPPHPSWPSDFFRDSLVPGLDRQFPMGYPYYSSPVFLPDLQGHLPHPSMPSSYPSLDHLKRDQR